MKSKKFLLLGAILTASASVPASAAITIEILDPISVAKIDKSAQSMKVSVDGKPVYSWKVSTGARGHATPVGDYSPYRMHT
ncbi:MAG: L,D-transpeptidase family protein, partial [Aestuariivirgaceae bacterium]